MAAVVFFRPGLFALSMLAFLGTVAAQDKGSAGAQSEQSKSSSAPKKAANPFSNNSKSGAPCEFPGWCGKCDCPDPPAAKDGAQKKKAPD